jgi:hypothetical protein
VKYLHRHPIELDIDNTRLAELIWVGNMLDKREEELAMITARALGAK